MLVSRGEIYTATLYKRIENSNDYYSVPTCSFKCKIVNADKTIYNVIDGMMTERKGIYIEATRLPAIVKPDDKIVLLGKKYIVENVGNFVSQARILSDSINSQELEKCFPKGLKLV